MGVPPYSTGNREQVPSGQSQFWTAHIKVKLPSLQHAMDEKKLATKHVPTEANIADISAKGLTSDRMWKLMNLMGMSLVAGMECLVLQPGENHGDVDS